MTASDWMFLIVSVVAVGELGFIYYLFSEIRKLVIENKNLRTRGWED